MASQACLPSFVGREGAEVNILLLGNDNRNLEFLSLIVRRVNLFPVVTHKLQEALTAHENSPGRLALVEITTSLDDLVHLCRSLRQHMVIPIVAISPWIDEFSMLRLYEAGVDDCLGRPYFPSILEAKIRALLRLGGSIPMSTLSAVERGAVRLDPEQHTFATPDGKIARLTPLEFRLLYALILNEGHVVPSDILVDKVWGYTGDGNRELLKGLIRRLRSKIEANSRHPRFVQTVSGIGYTFSFEEND